MRGGFTEHGPARAFGLGEMKSGQVYSVRAEGFILVLVPCSDALHNQKCCPDDSFAY